MIYISFASKVFINCSSFLILIAMKRTQTKDSTNTSSLLPPPQLRSEAEAIESYDLDSLISLHRWDPTGHVVGIDEAGRGPALGPMVYCGFAASLQRASQVQQLGVQDSKQLSPAKRDLFFDQLTALQCSNPRDFASDLDVISPERISVAMSSRGGVYSLNTVSHDSALGILQRLHDKGLVLSAIYVDTVGPPEKYRDKIKRHFPASHVVVCSKADAKYAVVSAASILAKVTRDRKIGELEQKYGVPVGSGYPADPVTQKFLKSLVHPLVGFPLNDVRVRWSTCEKIFEKHPAQIPVTFASDQEDKEKQSSRKYHKGKEVQASQKSPTSQVTDKKNESVEQDSDSHPYFHTCIRMIPLVKPSC